MKGILGLATAVFLCSIGLAGCGSPEFEEQGDSLRVTYQGAEWVLLPGEEEYVIEGVVRSFYRKRSGPYAVFCGTLTVQYELSDEELHEEFGDPGPILDELEEIGAGPCGQDVESLLRIRADTIVPIAEDRSVFTALTGVKPGDELYVEGEALTVESGMYKGKRAKKLSNVVLVTYAEVNGEAYGN